MRRFDTVLVANRGEIAVRVIRTLRRLGIRSVAVYSDADVVARHVREADQAVHIGPRSAEKSYLNIPAILRAATETGAHAIHPGYGFLAEDTEFASACSDTGIAFIGPPASAIESMGDKIRAKSTVRSAGVPVVPGCGVAGMSDARLADAAHEIGFPVLIKPSAGGGGKGMRTAYGPEELDERIAAARREARAAFGDDTLLLERYIAAPRHIEVQVLADRHGTVLHLSERECSLQRRHQKIIEEAPSPLLDEPTRQLMGAAAVAAARSVSYVGAGTVEFIVPGEQPDEFFFMEMNTRLQVEHPVTELVTTIGQRRGIDLVEWQLRIAEGEQIPFYQAELSFAGHAVEARLYAEDPASGFLPTGGTVLARHEPTGPGVRVDSGLLPGTEVGSDYDPMLAKVISWAATRDDALRVLDAALADTAILGVHTNAAFLRALLTTEGVRSGRMDTQLVERHLDELTASDTPTEVFVAAALHRLLRTEPEGPVTNPWDIPNGWRLGPPAWSLWRFTDRESAGQDAEVRVWIRGRAETANVAVLRAGSDPEHIDSASVEIQDELLVLRYRGTLHRYRCAEDEGTTWLAAGGHTWALAEHRLLAEPANRGGRSDGALTSPLPGTVLLAHAAVGQRVRAGEALFVVEAMKMEHTIAAPTDGVVTDVHVHTGEPVALDQALAVLTSEET